jgi:putative membrane protein
MPKRCAFKPWTGVRGFFYAPALVHVVQGFCMGSADIVPGVSGGTMALILGIYERLLGAIRSFDREWLDDILHLRFRRAFARNDLKFLFPLVLGIFGAILFFTRVIPLPTLIITHAEVVYGLFFGLILASIVVLMREVDHYGPAEIAMIAVGALFGFAVVNLVPLETPTALWFIFLCGFVAISAMLLPGISGSFLLLILGKYAYIIDAVGTLNLAVIVTFGAGALAGLILFSRAITWLLAHYHRATLLLIKGMLIGSLWIIWPFQEREYEVIHGKQKLVGASPVWPEAFNETVAAALACLLAGFVLVILIHRLAARRTGELR